MNNFIIYFLIIYFCFLFVSNNRRSDIVCIKFLIKVVIVEYLWGKDKNIKMNLFYNWMEKFGVKLMNNKVKEEICYCLGCSNNLDIKLEICILMKLYIGMWKVELWGDKDLKVFVRVYVSYVKSNKVWRIEN